MEPALLVCQAKQSPTRDATKGGTCRMVGAERGGKAEDIRRWLISAYGTG